MRMKLCTENRSVANPPASMMMMPMWMSWMPSFFQLQMWRVISEAIRLMSSSAPMRWPPGNAGMRKFPEGAVHQTIQLWK